MIALLQQVDTSYVVQVAERGVDSDWVKIVLALIAAAQAVGLAFLYRQGFLTHKAVNSERTVSTQTITDLRAEVSSALQTVAALNERLINTPLVQLQAPPIVVAPIAPHPSE